MPFKIKTTPVLTKKKNKTTPLNGQLYGSMSIPNARLHWPS